MTVASFRPRLHTPLRAVLWTGANLDEIEELFTDSRLVRALSVQDEVLKISDTSSSQWYIKPGHVVALSKHIFVYPEAEFNSKFEPAL